MKNEVYRVTAAFFLAFVVASASAHAQMGGAFPGGGFGTGGWRMGGGIAGGGWNAGGLPGAGFPAQVGPAAGFGGFAPGWNGGFPGQGIGFNGMPGAQTAWSYAHPYDWYNGSWHNHWYGNGFCGYRALPLTSASAPSSPWDRFGTGSGMGGSLSPNYPLGWGAGGWGMGSPWYGSGYVPYYNPYYDPGVTTAFNYGRPIPVPTGAQLPDTDNPIVALAIDQFRAGDNTKALSLVDGVIRIQPFDAAAHELRALILFATKDYTRAAATIHSVLATGPGWDWTTLSSVYSDMQDYQSQLAALEKYVAVHPKEAGARFLLAYHYMTAGHTDAAKEQLEQVVALVPSDKLAANLLHMAGKGAAAGQPAAAAGQPGAAAGQPGVPPPPAAAADDKPVDPAALVGHWQARRDDGAAFALELGTDKSFTWRFSQKNESQFINGKYTLDKATLTLQGVHGAMLAQVSIDGRNRFTFKPLDGPPGDPGLTFTR